MGAGTSWDTQEAPQNFSSTSGGCGELSRLLSSRRGKTMATNNTGGPWTDAVRITEYYKGRKFDGTLEVHQDQDGTPRLTLTVYSGGSGRSIAIAVDARNLVEISRMTDKAAGKATHLHTSSV